MAKYAVAALLRLKSLLLKYLFEETTRQQKINETGHLLRCQKGFKKKVALLEPNQSIVMQTSWSVTRLIFCQLHKQYLFWARNIFFYEILKEPEHCTRSRSAGRYGQQLGFFCKNAFYKHAKRVLKILADTIVN